MTVNNASTQTTDVISRRVTIFSEVASIS